jgi:hypothetical protein
MLQMSSLRPWQPGDSLDAPTALLHRAYAPLAAAGMSFTAATQTAAMTAQRLQGARTWVAVQADGALVGTITATVQALWASFQARDWAAARGFLADDATLFWRASGEHLQDADAIIRVQVIYPEGWTLRVVDVTPMADGRVHSLVEVRHGGACFLAHTLWRFRGALVVQADETWATWEAPPAWRTAEAIGAYRRDGEDRHAGQPLAEAP